MNKNVQTKKAVWSDDARLRQLFSLGCAGVIALACVTSATAAPPSEALKKRGIQVKADVGDKPAKPINEPLDPTAPVNPPKPLKPEEVKGPHPVIKVDEETHDFGAGWVGPPLKHSFKITNGGDATL